MNRLFLIGLLFLLISYGCASSGGSNNPTSQTPSNQNEGNNNQNSTNNTSPITLQTPTDLNITINDGKLMVTWNVVDGASLYKINVTSKYNLDGSSFLNEIEMSDPKLEHTGLINGHEYCYSIKAKNKTLESTSSGQVCGRPTRWIQAAAPIGKEVLGMASIPTAITFLNNDILIKSGYIRRWTGADWIPYSINYVMGDVMKAYNGQLYVGWGEYSATNYRPESYGVLYYIAIVNDNKWTTLDVIDPFHPSVDFNRLDFAVNGEGIIYVAYVTGEEGVYSHQDYADLYVRYVEPLTGKWQFLGERLNENGIAWNPSIVVTDTVYIAWEQCNESRCFINMKMWDMLNGSWIPIDISGLIETPIAHIGKLVSGSTSSSDVYILWTEFNEQYGRSQGFFAHWDGKQWAKLKPAPDDIGNQDYDITVCGNNLYMVTNYPDVGVKANHIIVYRWDDFNWQVVGGSNFDTLNSHNDISTQFFPGHFICGDNDMPIVGFVEKLQNGENKYLLKTINRL